MTDLTTQPVIELPNILFDLFHSFVEHLPQAMRRIKTLDSNLLSPYVLSTRRDVRVVAWTCRLDAGALYNVIPFARISRVNICS